MRDFFRLRPTLSGIGLHARRLKEALALVDVRVLDHFVVSAGESVSFAERGLPWHSLFFTTRPGKHSPSRQGRQQVGKEAMGDPGFGCEFTGRQRQGARHGGATADAPPGFVANLMVPAVSRQSCPARRSPCRTLRVSGSLMCLSHRSRSYGEPVSHARVAG